MTDSDQIVERTKRVEIFKDQIQLIDTKTPVGLAIDRVTGIMKKTEGTTSTPGGAVLQTLPIHGLYGIIDLVESKYLILITKAVFVGQILSKKIFRVSQLDYLPIRNPDGHDAAPRTTYLNASFPKDKEYLDMLRHYTKRDHFYYSYEYDLSSSLPKVVEKSFSMKNWNSDFFYNQVWLLDIIALNAENWILPVISGLVEETHGLIRNKEYDFLIITRRSKGRAGLRFVSRGLDWQGNSSNFAETEQILILNELAEARLFSYVQIRGSVPLIWEQKPSLKWEPKPFLRVDREENVSVAAKHFKMLTDTYGAPAVLVNLIDKKRNQKVMGEEYSFVVNRQNNSDLRLLWFDFHHECRKNKYENLSKLVGYIGNSFQTIGYSEFNVQKNKGLAVQTVKKQVGVIRSNCMDSLDRTNVVQSVFGRHVLHTIFYDCGMGEPGKASECFEKFEGQLEDQFRNAWTNNANALSILYTGTPAMKTDFTRTGKRTYKGNLADGKFSITRYVLNNFYDGYNQNCVDLLLGKLKPKETPYTKPPVGKFLIALAMVLIIPIIGSFVHGGLVNQMTQGGSVAVPTWKLAGFSLIFYALTIGAVLASITGNPSFFIEKPVKPH